MKQESTKKGSLFNIFRISFLTKSSGTNVKSSKVDDKNGDEICFLCMIWLLSRVNDFRKGDVSVSTTLTSEA